MKHLKNKTTSKKVNFKAFNEISVLNLGQIKGGHTETPPEESQNDHDK